MIENFTVLALAEIGGEPGAIIGLGLAILAAAGTGAVGIFKSNEAFAKVSLLEAKFHDLDKRLGISDAKADATVSTLDKMEKIIEAMSTKIDTLLERRQS